MIVILNSKTHVGANPPSDTTKTWISADMTEISIYPEPETYGRLNARIDVKAILLAHNLDIKSDRVRVFSLADDVLEVKRYINGEWIVIDNPDDYVDIIMNGKVIGTMEVDTIAPDEQVDEWDGSGVVITPIEPEQPMTFTINGTSYQMDNRMTWYAWTRSDYNTDGFSCASENDYVYEAESTNKVTDADGNDVLGTTYIVEGGAYLIKEEATTDELSGTWVFNDALNGSSGDWSFDFGLVADYGLYGNANRMRANASSLYFNIFNNDEANYIDTRVYFHTWIDTRFQSIVITSKLSEVTNGSTLLTWLKANATKQGATSLISFTIGGTTYQAEEGMTWYEWCHSNYNTYGYSTLNDAGAYVYQQDGAYADYVCTESGVLSSRVVGTDIINATTYYHYRYSGGDGN